MRLLFIVCESSVEGRVAEILNGIGAPGYTRFTNLSGRGRHGLRDGSAIWPGLNDILMSCVPEALVAAVLEGLQNLENERGGRLAVKVFSVPAEEYL
jgi:hypothetical protein